MKLRSLRTPGKRLVTHHLVGVHSEDRLKERLQIVVEDNLEYLGSTLERPMQLLITNTLPRLVYESGNQPFRHDQWIVQHETVADRHLEILPDIR